MRHLLLLVLLGCSSATQADDSPAVAACKAVARSWSLNPQIDFAVVQDFSTLSPPHIRLGVPAQSGAGNVEMSCEFDRPQPPMTLTSVCQVFCLPPRPDNDMDALLAPSSPLTLEELNYLLDQDGF